MKDLLDLRKVLTKDHEEKWVALSGDYKKVVGFSKSLVALQKQIGTTKVVYLKVPASGMTYAFFAN